MTASACVLSPSVSGDAAEIAFSWAVSGASFGAEGSGAGPPIWRAAMRATWSLSILGSMAMLVPF